jgi:hypothetical protein
MRVVDETWVILVDVGEEEISSGLCGSDTEKGTGDGGQQDVR